MLNKKTTILIALSLTLLNTHTNAGFFDNLADNLQSGDLGSLLTDAVKDVALEVQKSNDKNQDAGTSFGSTTSDEEYGLESELDTSVAPEAQGDRTVDGKDLTRKTSFFGPKDDKAYYKDETKPYTGVVITKHANGKTQSIWNLVDGLQSGLMKDYHPNGNLESQHTVLNQKLEGKAVGYYSNGTKSFEKFFKDGELEGEYFSWYENGNKKFKAYYIEGKQNGLTQEWYENGNKKLEQTALNDRIQFPYTAWFENGEVSMIHYGFPLAIPGTKFPAYDKFYENGNLKESHKIIGNYRSLEMFYENGNQLQSMLVNVYGKPHQYQNSWYENGEMKIEEFYVEGDRKMQTMWDEDGSILETNDTGFRYSMVVDLEDLAKQ